jgi:hypothetical protein
MESPIWKKVYLLEIVKFRTDQFLKQHFKKEKKSSKHKAILTEHYAKLLKFAKTDKVK